MEVYVEFQQCILNGYALTEITELKAANKKIYRMDYYRSNGSPEIYIFYDNNGSRLCKMDREFQLCLFQILQNPFQQYNTQHL